MAVSYRALSRIFLPTRKATSRIVCLGLLASLPETAASLANQDIHRNFMQTGGVSGVSPGTGRAAVIVSKVADHLAGQQAKITYQDYRLWRTTSSSPTRDRV